MFPYQVVPVLYIDARGEEEPLYGVYADGSGEAHQRVDREQEPLLLVRLRGEDQEPEVERQQDQRARDVSRVAAGGGQAGGGPLQGPGRQGHREQEVEVEEAVHEVELGALGTCKQKKKVQ